MLSQPAPGVYFEIKRPPEDPSPPRSDIAGFVGRARRGPVGEVVRVAEWPEYERLFGGLDADSLSSYAVKSYFENGGDTAYVVRLGGAGAVTARATWPMAGDPHALPAHRIVSQTGAVQSSAFLSGAQAVASLECAASSPGKWANDVEIDIEYRRQGSLGEPEVDIRLRARHERGEVIRALPARLESVPRVTGAPPDENLVNAVERLSRFIRLAVDSVNLVPPSNQPGPNRQEWKNIRLTGGANPQSGVQEYLAAVDAISREPAVAILAFPDLYNDLGFDFDPSLPAVAQPSIRVLRAAVMAAERLHDRLVLVDLPTDDAVAARPMTADRIISAVSSLREAFEANEWRAAAVYHPPIWVRDPLGRTATPQRLVPASGSVAGVIARLDIERGAHHTPANAALYDAVDALQPFDAVDQGRLNHSGVNLIRCFSGRGLFVWGGRTLDTHPDGKFVAHRRLTHRIVRAIHRVAQPLVFDINGPELWLTLVRGITSVLLEAYRSGALKGARPEEAFRVKCDDEINPPDERDLGRVTCVIEFAPAVPMEFITLRVAIGREGNLEVFEQ